MRSIGPQKRDSAAPTLLVMFGVSTLLHVPLLMAIAAYQPDDSPYESTTFDAADLVVNVVTDPFEEKEEEKKKEEDDDEKAQIVSAALPEREEIPDKAEFLDRVASKTEKQTVRKGEVGSPLLPSNARRSPTAGDSERRETFEDPAARENVPIDEKDQESTTSTEEEKGEEAVDRTEDIVNKRDTPAPNSSGKVDPREYFPNVSNTRYVNPKGQGGEIDYLRDVEEGEKTLLNRKRTRYWAFFDRVKIQIAEQWDPRSEYRRRDPTGDVYGVKDRYSTVRVTLNGDGTVRKLYVSRPSGLDFYDDVAVRSVRAAAPFHNAPEGLKDEDGLIHFTFGFYFEITHGPQFRIFN